MSFLFVDSLPKSKNGMLRGSIKAIEVLLLSAGLISTVLMVKGAVMPYSSEFVLSSLMVFWNSIRCFFSSPLYIFIFITFMVLAIRASSAFHCHENDRQGFDNYDIIFGVDDDHAMQITKTPPPAPPPPVRDVFENAPLASPPVRDVFEVAPPPPPPQNATTAPSAPPLPPQEAQTSTKTATTSTPYPSTDDEIKKTSSFFDKALVSEAKEIKKRASCSQNPPPDTSESNEEEEDDTMEATWRAITGEGKQRPKKKHLKKSETWDVQQPPRVVVAPQRLDSEEVLPSTPKWKELRKSETFDDAVSMTRRGGLRRDPSMSLDELNRRVEAFIQNFTNDMKLQRQESDQRFLDMINRGLQA